MSNNPNRAWTMDEMINHSANWNLSGDVALLQSLKEFANKIITTSTEVNNKLTQLNTNLDETKLKLNLAQNKLHSLRNTQFIESRVYEDDETLPLEEESKPEEPQNDPRDDKEFRKRVTERCLETLFKYYEKVEIPVSDSEEDDDEPKEILRRKDLYLHRPLPYVIGTDEWHKHGHCGLQDSSESESEQSEKFSESSDDGFTNLSSNQPKIGSTKLKNGSETSSELDFSHKNERNVKQDTVASSEDSSNSVQSYPSKNFAEQLAEKLGNVINEEVAEVNTRPLQKPEPAQYANIFFDEPPPLEEHPSKGLFSGGSGLFDEISDEEPKVSPISNQNPIKKPQKDLFDEESSDDELFKPAVAIDSKSNLITGPPKPSLPVFNEEPPELNKIKKPVGGVSVFGNVKIGANILRRQKSSSEDEKEDVNTQPAPKVTSQPKKISLFDNDDGDELENTDPVVVKEDKKSAKKKIGLFDSDNESEKEEKSSTEPKIEQKSLTESKNKLKKGLFDDDDDDFFKTDIFSSTSKNFTSSLFDNDEFSEKPEVKVTKSSLFDDDDVEPIEKAAKPVEKEPKTSLFDEKSLNLAKEEDKTQAEPLKVSLFDSPPPVDNFFDTFGDPEDFHPIKADLFSNIGIAKSSTPEKVEKSDEKSRVGLFDSTPPPDDDDWDRKSENEYNDNNEDDENPDKFDDLFSPIKEEKSVAKIMETDEINNKKVELPTETVEIKQEEKKALPSKLKHNLNINVAALMPGLGPPKLIKKQENAPPSFDTVDNVQVLHNVTKDRARGAVKRRPSTRKGRKAALEQTTETGANYNAEENVKQVTEEEPKVKEEKNSVFGLLDEQKNEDLFTQIEPKKIQKAENKSIVSLFDDDEASSEDLFANLKSDIAIKPDKDKKSIFDDEPKNISVDSFEKVEESEKKEKNISIFDDEDDDGDFFDKVEPSKDLNIPKEATTSKLSSIFDDEDQEDDLFGKTVKNLPSKVIKKSLFDDEDSDDDFFKSDPKITRRSQVSVTKKIPKMSNIKKLKNDEPEEDPLSALLK